MSACTKHAAEPVRGYSDCPGCEVESLRQQLAAAQAEARNWKRIAEDATHVEREELTRVREIVSGMREYADSCDHPSEASKRNAVEYWLTQLEDALSPAPEPAPAPELLVIGVDLAAPGADRTVKAVIKQTPEYESLPLMARDTCTNCGGTGVGGYHVHAPQEDAVEALRCEACDGFGFIEHGPKDCPATAPELPLMARRPRHKDDDLGELYENGKRLCTISGEPPLREPMPGFVLYRIADTDEHGLKVIPRTADMPEGAKYRLTWIMQADAAGGDVEYTDSLPLALEANRSGAVSERIEEYRESGKEGKE